jgi:16S rRNA processing protein RimM
VARPDGSTALVPVVDAFIAAVDVDERTVETTLPDGLLDL